MSFGSPSVTKATVHYYDEDKENDHQDDIKSFKEVQEYLYGSPEEYLEIIAEDKLRGLKVRLYLPTGDKSSILNGYVQVWADPSSLTNWMEKMLDHEFQQKTKQLANLDTRIRKASAYLEGNLD